MSFSIELPQTYTFSLCIDRDSFERSDEDTTECMRCGGIIHYQRIVTIEYTTVPVKPPKLIRAHWVKDT